MCFELLREKTGQIAEAVEARFCRLFFLDVQFNLSWERDEIEMSLK